MGETLLWFPFLAEYAKPHTPHCEPTVAPISLDPAQEINFLLLAATAFVGKKPRVTVELCG